MSEENKAGVIEPTGKETMKLQAPLGDGQHNIGSDFNKMISSAARGVDPEDPKKQDGEPGNKEPDKVEPDPKATKEPEKKEPEKKGPEGDDKDIELPPWVSQNAKEGFDKVKSQRDEWKGKYEELNKKLEASELDDVHPASVLEADEYIALKTEMENLKKEYETAEERLGDLSAKAKVWDLQNDPEFKAKYDQPLLRAEKDLVNIINFGDDVDELTAKAKVALSQADDREFYRLTGEMAEELPSYAGTNLVSIMNDMRHRITEREQALKDNESSASTLMEEKQRRLTNEAKQYRNERVPEIARALNQYEEGLNKYKETDAVKALLDPIKDQSAAIHDRTMAVIEDAYAKNGGVHDELVALALQGAKRAEDVVLTKTISEQYAALHEEHEKLKEAYKAVSGSERVEPKSSSGGEGSDDKGDKPTSFAEFFSKGAS